MAVKPTNQESNPTDTDDAVRFDELGNEVPYVDDAEWEDVEGEIVTFNDFPVIAGSYRGWRAATSEFGPGLIHTVNRAHDVVAFWGTVGLDRQLERVGVGAEVMIEYQGEVPIPGSTKKFKQFRVRVRRGR